MTRRTLNPPDVALSGVTKPFQLLFDPFVVLSVVVVVVMAITLPFTPNEVRALIIPVLPVLIWRSRRISSASEVKTVVPVAEDRTHVIDIRDAVLAAQKAVDEESKLRVVRD